jgi:hypothetical protein
MFASVEGRLVTSAFGQKRTHERRMNSRYWSVSDWTNENEASAATRERLHPDRPLGFKPSAFSRSAALH